MNYKTLMTISAFALSMTAFAQYSGSSMGQDMSATSMSAKDVCQKLAQIDQAKSAQMDKWIYGKAYNKRWIKSELGSGDCSSETIAGNHAVVTVKGMDKIERLIPFIKQDNMWKLDAQAFQTLYRMDMRMPASE